MPRDIPLGNGSLLVTHDHNYRLRDIFFPSIGKENHTGGHGCRLGIWVDNVFAWMSSDWHPKFSYIPESLVSEVNAFNLLGYNSPPLAAKKCYICVCPKANTYTNLITYR